MPTPRETTTDPRAKVLASALALFTRKGYFNTSMRDVTHHSGVSTGSVYHHFKDKEGVAAALYESLLERMTAELVGIRQEYESAHDQCRAVVALLFRITEREPDVMNFMLYVKHREFLPNERPICSSKPFDILRDMVQHGMTRGEIAPGDLLVVSSCLFGGPIRLVTAALDGILEQPLRYYFEETWRFSWRAVATVQ